MNTPSPSLSLFIQNLILPGYILLRIDNNLDFTVPYLIVHTHFFIPFLSLTSHPLSYHFLCVIQIRRESLHAVGEKTFLLKAVFFFHFSFSHFVLYLFFSIPSLIDFLSYISSFLPLHSFWSLSLSLFLSLSISQIWSNCSFDITVHK